MPTTDGPLDRPSLRVVEAVEPRREQRLHRGRDGDRAEVTDLQGPVGGATEHAVVEEHLDDLLDVERVAVRGGGDAHAGLLGERRPLEQLVDEALGVATVAGARAGTSSRWACRRSSLRGRRAARDAP